MAFLCTPTALVVSLFFAGVSLAQSSGGSLRLMSFQWCEDGRCTYPDDVVALTPSRTDGDGLAGLDQSGRYELEWDNADPDRDVRIDWFWDLDDQREDRVSRWSTTTRGSSFNFAPAAIISEIVADTPGINSTTSASHVSVLPGVATHLRISQGSTSSDSQPFMLVAPGIKVFGDARYAKGEENGSNHWRTITIVVGVLGGLMSLGLFSACVWQWRKARYGYGMLGDGMMGRGGYRHNRRMGRGMAYGGGGGEMYGGEEMAYQGGHY